MQELTRMTTEELLEHRRLKFRAIGLGGFKVDPDLEPERKRSMKASDVNALKFKDIESELDDLKKAILGAKGPSDPITEQKLEELEDDLDDEMTKAIIAMGLAEKIESLNLELAKASDPDKAMNEDLKERADEIMQEINRNLSLPGAYLVLKRKLQTLEIANKLLEAKASSEKLKNELNQNLSPEIKQRFEALNRARENLSRGDGLDEDLISQVEEAKEELEEVLRSAKLEVVGTTKREALHPPHEVREEMARLDREIKEEIKNVIDEKGLSSKIDELREEAAKDSNSEKVRKMEAEIREEIGAALAGSPLRERLESLRRLQGESSSDTVVVEENVGINNGTARV